MQLYISSYQSLTTPTTELNLGTGLVFACNYALLTAITTVKQNETAK